MTTLSRLITGACLALLGFLAVIPAEAQVLRPGTGVTITPDGRTTQTRAPRPTRNPDGSITSPAGTPLPRGTDGFIQGNPDGSTTVFPRRGTPAPRPAPPLRPGTGVKITPDGRTISPPAPRPTPLRPGTGVTITPDGRTISPPAPRPTPLRPGTGVTITPDGRTLSTPAPRPTPLRPGTGVKITPDGRTVSEPMPRPTPLRPGTGVKITPDGRTVSEPAPRPMPAPMSSPKSPSTSTTDRASTGTYTTPDGKKFSTLGLGRGGLRLTSDAKSR